MGVEQLVVPAGLLAVVVFIPSVALEVIKVVLYLRCFLAAVNAYLSWSAAISKRTSVPPQRWALITGASSGIGWEIASQLAREKYSLILVARREERLQDLAKSLGTLTDEVVYCVADLSGSQGAEKVIKFVEDKGIVLDVLVNNAGGAPLAQFLNFSVPSMEKAVYLNVMAVMKLTLAFVPKMVERGYGRVLMLSSVGAQVPIPYSALYSGSKAFLSAFTASINHELSGTGVTVTAIQPGPVDTPLLQEVKGSFLFGKRIGARGCAETAVEAMHRGEDILADTWMSTFSILVLGYLLPRRISTWAVEKAFCPPGSQFKTKKA